jgi:Holliday junction resolvase RusA-like endonuclease
MKISFSVDAIPVAQPRHQTKVLTDADGKVLRGANNRAKVLEFIPSDHQIHQFKFLVREEARRAMAREGIDKFPHGQPLVLNVKFYLPRPKWANQEVGRKIKVLKYSPGPLLDTCRPDLDNLLKGVKDAMSKVVWDDDSDVALYGPGTGKWYHGISETFRVDISVWTVPIEYQGPDEEESDEFFNDNCLEE